MKPLDMPKKEEKAEAAPEEAAAPAETVPAVEEKIDFSNVVSSRCLPIRWTSRPSPGAISAP